MYIYKIWSNKGSKCYIGSTTQSLNQRFSKHKWDYKCWKEGKLNKNITSFDLFEEYGFENCCIELLEEVNDISQLKIREQFWINNTQNIVNNFRAIFIGHKEYYKNNLEYFKEYFKKYYEHKKEHIKEYKKKYTKEKVKCECGSFISRSSLTRHKKQNCKLTIR